MENLIKLIFILISLVVTFSSGIKWDDGDGTKYANKCDFPGNDFENVTKSPVNECGGECQNRPRCTHFAWTEDEKDGSGTCWLKHDNKISLSDAVETSDEKMVCGVLKKTIDRVEMMQAKSSGNQVTFKIKNRCKFKIWPGFIGKSKSNPKWPQPLGGGWELAAGKSTTLRVPKDLFASRIWARTNCTTKNGRFSCETGDCGGSSVKCSGRSGATPATLAEFTLNGSGKKDYYDVSLVDGYNIQMSIKPTKPNRDETGKYWCKTTDCKQDLNSICPKKLQKKVGKKVVGCLSACEKFNTDLYCCRGQHNKPETCRSSSWPTNYAAVFKRACPTAYSYAYDDSTSTFMCRNTDYEITFC